MAHALFVSRFVESMALMFLPATAASQPTNAVPAVTLQEYLSWQINVSLLPQVTVEEILDLLWIHPNDAEWTPKADAIPLAQVKEWMASTDIEVLGLAHALILERRFPIEPELSLGDSIPFFKHYYGRCFRESPDGEWSDSR
jgi:hypothetical protein